jgi:hypothetical protein
MKPLLDDPEEIVRVAAKKALESVAPEEFPAEKPAETTPATKEPAKDQAPSA